MELNSGSRYHLKITADQRAYADWKKTGSVPIEIKYADNCKQCKRHSKNLKKRKYELRREHKKKQEKYQHHHHQQHQQHQQHQHHQHHYQQHYQQQQQQRQQQHYIPKKTNYTMGSSEEKKNKKTHFMKISTAGSPLTLLHLHGQDTQNEQYQGTPLSAVGKRDWDPHMTMTSPVEWETSPLVINQSPSSSVLSSPNGDTNGDIDKPYNANLQQYPSNSKFPTTPVQLHQNGQNTRRPDIMPQPWHSNTEDEDKHLPDVIANNDATMRDEITTSSNHQNADTVTPKPPIRSSKNTTTSSNNYKNNLKSDQILSTHAQDSEHFIVVNIPENAFTNQRENRKSNNQHLNDTALSVADDTATVVSEGVKCRYCLINDTLNNEALISPCHCCGTSKFVHKSCLEKWLTLRNLDSCEVCKMQYRTKWVHRPLCSLNFPTMKKRDIFLLGITVAFYITLIFQFLGIVYISLMSNAEAMSPMVTGVTLVALSLGLLWFLVGSIALTIILYTSEYWRAWRKANKKKTIVMSSNNNTNQHHQNADSPSKNGFPRDLSHAVAV